MLVLRRKVGEAIILDGIIRVEVLGVEGDRVKIGIAAPPDVPIVREELLQSSRLDTEPVPEDARTSMRLAKNRKGNK